MQEDLPRELAAKVRYRTEEASRYLSAVHGVTVAPATLNKYRSVGGGPDYRKCLRSALYDREALDNWARQKLGEPIHSTSRHP